MSWLFLASMNSVKVLPAAFVWNHNGRSPLGVHKNLKDFMWGGGPNVDIYIYIFFSLEITYLIPSTPYFMYKRAGEEKGKHFMVFGKGAGLPKQLNKKNSGENTYQTLLTYLDDL